MNKFLKSFAALVSLVVLLAACGNASDNEENASNDTEIDNQEIEFNDDEILDEDIVVAQINDVEVTGEMYNSIYIQTKIHLDQIGQDTSDVETLKAVVMDGLINQEIIRQDAQRMGIVVSDEEVTSEFETIKSENEEQFQIFLDRYQLTEETFKDQLYFALLHDKYIASEIPDIQISDQEVEVVYNELKKENEGIAALEDVAEQLKRELTIQKEQEVLKEKLDELKEQATIEELI